MPVRGNLLTQPLRDPSQMGSSARRPREKDQHRCRQKVCEVSGWPCSRSDRVGSATGQLRRLRAASELVLASQHGGRSSEGGPAFFIDEHEGPRLSQRRNERSDRRPTVQGTDVWKRALRRVGETTAKLPKEARVGDGVVTFARPTVCRRVTSRIGACSLPYTER